MSRIGRIRSIKPEFFSSPSTAVASPFARLLYIAMWTFADDAGHAEWNPASLMGYAFPNGEMRTSKQFVELVHEVHMAYDVTFYRVKGRRYYEIPTWVDHQKTGGRKSFRHPGPDDENATPDQEFLTSPVPGTGLSSEILRDPPKSYVELGEQGEQGEQGNKPRSGSRATSTSPEVDEQFQEFWDAYAYKVDRADAYEAWGKHRGKVDATVIVDGARRYVAWLGAHRDPPSQKHAATFLNKRGWESEFSPPRGTTPRTAPMKDFN